jgi:uncharacterized protein (TIGR02246 family)
MTAQPTGEAREAIAAANQNFMASFARGDAAGMAALYTANGQLLPTHSDFITGTQAIQGFWQAVIDMGIKEATLETLEVEGQNEMAYEVGKFALRGSAGQILDRGKYVVIWKREGGRWKLHRDIWNTSMPATEP